ncbi:MAG: C40 family peptidase [Lachnospiraceae bacterium]|nr:C40 family peptidase [Lachnospiraceae bacterium]
MKDNIEDISLKKKNLSGDKLLYMWFGLTIVGMLGVLIAFLILVGSGKTDSDETEPTEDITVSFVDETTTEATSEEQTAEVTTEEATAEPTTEEPSAVETTPEPVTEEPTTEEPTTPEPTTEEPTTPEPTTEEPTTEEPTTEEPTTAYDPRRSVLDNYNNLGFIVVSNYLHIRSTPSTSGDIVGILYTGAGVDILDVSADNMWYHINSNDIEGYIYYEYVALGAIAEKAACDFAYPAVTVNAQILNVREAPTTESKIVQQITAGSLYYVIEETNESWLKIEIGGEIQGYVAREFVTYSYQLPGALPYTPPPPEEPAINPLRLEIINTAMSYVGGKYVWGGTTLGVGVDCSGFCQQVLLLYGIEIPRTSYTQVNAGVPVSFEEMQPGDLIFFWNESLGRIGHVAMYIGDGKMVHAASEHRGIVIDYYTYMTPYCARNVIGE